MNRQRDAALLRELEGVREQILEHLLEALAVAVDGRRRVGLDVDGERQTLLMGNRLERALRERLDVLDGKVHRAHLHLARLHLRQIKNVVDEVEQVRTRRVDRLRELDLPGREILVLVVAQQLGQDEQ